MVECESVNVTAKNNQSVVLIDTWWNVNHGEYAGFTGWFLGFNRYMVECEFASIPLTSTGYVRVLIDTWWNVNRGFFIELTGDMNVLIDTWWNVNAVIFL